MRANNTGKNEPSLAVPHRGRGGGGDERCRIARAASSGSGSCPTRRPRQTRLRSGGGGRPTIGVLRRSRDPDSDTGRRRAPASRTSFSATPRIPWISGSSIWPAPSPFSSPAAEARTSHRTTRGMSQVWRATTRENGRSSSSGRFAPASGAAFAPGGFLPVAFSVWDGFSRERGNRRGLTAGYSIYVEPASRPIGRRPDGEDGAAYSRHRASRDRLGAPALTARHPRGVRQ